ncbi:MAG: hypothetical protein K0R98_1862 [Rickettsiaceae bacterium]|jgi:serine/threonine protein kinase|nr:hypothetical protein [Rickettsiaceae bacterium]
MRRRRQKKITNPLIVPVPTIISQQLRFDLDQQAGRDKILLGEGSFGKVYAGRCQEGAVAVKLLHVSTPQLSQTLYKEAAEVFNAWSSYIVTLYGIYLNVDAEEIALVMEYMPGGSLFNLLQDDTQDFPWLLRYQIAYEIAEGISSLHQQFIIHGNLKSTNVMLDKDQHVALTNFGFSKSRNQMRALLDVSGHPARTLAYEAPEIASLNLSAAAIDDKREKLYSGYSDIYAYGVLLWELATRKIPFEGKDPLTVLTILSQGKTEKIPMDCPVRFAALIKACWAIKPEMRPSAPDLLTQIKALYIDELEAERAKRYIAEETYEKCLAAEGLEAAFKARIKEEKGLVAIPPNIKKRQKGKTKFTAKRTEVINECRTKRIAIESAIEQAEKNAIEQIENWAAKASLRSLQIKKNLQEAIDKKLSELIVKESLQATENKEEESVSPSANPRDILEITLLLKRGDQAAVQDKLRINSVLAASKELFLLFVAAGEQNQAEAMVRANPKLSVAKGTITDLSGRTFKDITGFQYAVWALDWHMWKMLFNISDPTSSYLSAAQAAIQVAALPYGEWVKEYGMHFSFDPLIHALEICLNYYDACRPGKKNTKGDRAWRQQVGRAQLFLPAHVINEYCRPDRSFYPTPDFLDANLPRSMKTDEGFWFTTVYEDGKLGVKFGIYRAGRRRAMVSAEEKSFDGQSIRVLARTRLQQYESLRSNLKQYASSAVDMEEIELALAEMITAKSKKQNPQETYKVESIAYKNSQIFEYSMTPAKVNIRKIKSPVSAAATKKAGLFQNTKINGIKARHEEIEFQNDSCDKRAFSRSNNM